MAAAHQSVVLTAAVSLVPHGNQARLGRRICSGEERDVVPELDQAVGEVCDAALGAPVQPGRHRFV